VGKKEKFKDFLFENPLEKEHRENPKLGGKGIKKWAPPPPKKKTAFFSVEQIHFVQHRGQFWAVVIRRISTRTPENAWTFFYQLEIS